jgi:hypothetical protein
MRRPVLGLCESKEPCPSRQRRDDFENFRKRAGGVFVEEHSESEGVLELETNLQDMAYLV